MSFFNIVTDVKGELETSKIKVGDLNGRTESVMKFIKKMMNPRTTHMVGVSMDIIYMNETRPTHKTPGNDKKEKVNYVFTLELDEENTIIGGEWLHNQHPDFLWAPANGAKPLNDEDIQISSTITGDISSPDVLSKLTQYAASASSRGEVLDIVIQYLVAKSAGSQHLRESSVVIEYNRLRDTYERASN